MNINNNNTHNVFYYVFFYIYFFVSTLSTFDLIIRVPNCIWFFNQNVFLDISLKHVIDYKSDKMDMFSNYEFFLINNGDLFHTYFYNEFLYHYSNKILNKGEFYCISIFYFFLCINEIICIYTHFFLVYLLDYFYTYFIRIIIKWYF